MTGSGQETGRRRTGRTQQPARQRRPAHLAWSARCALISLFASFAGCSSLTSARVEAVSVERVPREIIDVLRKDEFQEISLARLRQDPPDQYLLAAGDLLGIYIEDLLGDIANPDDEGDKTPAFALSGDPDLPPIVGVPIPVSEAGTIDLPVLGPVNVGGQSVVEVTRRLRDMYRRRNIILPGEEARILVTVIKRRTVRVLVVRNESGGVQGVAKRGTGQVLYLPGYENDLLHALNRSGGLPGLDAKNEVFIYRGLFDESVKADEMITALMASEGCDPCFCNAGEIPQPPTVTRIPIRFHPSRPPEFEQEDVILQNGDIVMIKSRDEETFYTGGLLGGAEIPLPRDKDLDVLGAVALAGGQIGSSGSAIMAIAGQGGNRSGGGRGVGRSGGACPPSELLVLRELPCDKQITMKVDLNQALVDRASRIVIKPNDVLILRYTFTEEISNALLGIIQFNFLFNGLRGGGF